jgi:small subunit ribosomal protein S5
MFIILLCRDALNNLVYIDLYENAGLAHDVKGKYNNCYVYIRATPKDRVMVANQTVEAILNRLGITSVSCKVVGRRNPYAMVRALFRALEKHSNLDEIAKARGKRYLTLKWMYDQNL